jgi:hypothetical protein
MIMRARLLSLTLALAAVLASAAARADAPAGPRAPPPPPSPPPPGAARVEIHVTFPPWQYAGKFLIQSASGEQLDAGAARDDGGFAPQETSVERVLEGARGTLVLRVQGGARVPRFPALFGRWTIVRGTGAYAGAVGGGTFTSCSSGETGKGSPFERQTLVGHARLR